jgi:hypothetical protein
LICGNRSVALFEPALPALRHIEVLVRLALLEDVHVVGCHALLRDEHLLAAVDDEVATLQYMPAAGACNTAPSATRIPFKTQLLAAVDDEVATLQYMEAAAAWAPTQAHTSSATNPTDHNPSHLVERALPKRHEVCV